MQVLSSHFKIIDVHQGDNFSPLLFTLILNDLEYFLDQPSHRINTDYIIDDDISVFFNLFILLYAGDTVIYGANKQTLIFFQMYCETWK